MAALRRPVLCESNILRSWIRNASAASKNVRRRTITVALHRIEVPA